MKKLVVLLMALAAVSAALAQGTTTTTTTTSWKGISDVPLADLTVPASQKAIMKPEGVWIALRDVEMFFKATRTYDAATKALTIVIPATVIDPSLQNSPDRVPRKTPEKKVVLTMGSDAATVDGVAVKMAYPLTVINGVGYVHARSLVSVLDEGSFLYIWLNWDEDEQALQLCQALDFRHRRLVCTVN